MKKYKIDKKKLSCYLIDNKMTLKELAEENNLSPNYLKKYATAYKRVNSVTEKSKYYQNLKDLDIFEGITKTHKRRKMNKYIKEVINKEAILKDIKEWFVTANINDDGNIVLDGINQIWFNEDGTVNNTLPSCPDAEERIYEITDKKLSIEKLIIKTPKRKKYFDPAKDEEYFYIAFDRGMRSTHRTSNYDETIISLQPVFKTKLEAVKELVKKRATLKVNRAIDELNDGWVPDWDDGYDVPKIHIYRDHWSNSFDIDYSFHSSQTLDYIKTEEIAWAIIVGYEEELKIIFDIEE